MGTNERCYGRLTCSFHFLCCCMDDRHCSLSDFTSHPRHATRFLALPHRNRLLKSNRELFPSLASKSFCVRIARVTSHTGLTKHQTQHIDRCDAMISLVWRVCSLRHTPITSQHQLSAHHHVFLCSLRRVSRAIHYIAVPLHCRMFALAGLDSRRRSSNDRIACHRHTDISLCLFAVVHLFNS